MLSVSGLNAFYGSSHIIQGIDLSVPEGSRVALLGRNGVGKSTLLKSIMNAGPRVRGLVEWDGRALGELPAYKRARLGMAFVPEERCIVGHLTVMENLELACRGVPRERPAGSPLAVIERFPMLASLESRLGGKLSGGQQQMLAVARAVVTRPRLMLLDEPTEGLAPAIVEQLAASVVTICRDAQMALLLCEQNLWFARRCTDSLYVIDSGRIVFAGTWNQFDLNTSVKAEYLSV